MDAVSLKPVKGIGIVYDEKPQIFFIFPGSILSGKDSSGQILNPWELLKEMFQFLQISHYFPNFLESEHKILTMTVQYL